MKDSTENSWFRGMAVLWTAGILGLVLSGCSQAAGGNENPPQYTPRYTITFETHGGPAVAAVTADEGTPVRKPVDPVRSGYTFLGWFPPESGGPLYVWPHILTGHITMHARWRDDALPPLTRYTITFDTGGGPAIDAIQAYDETRIAKPVDPVRSGYTFTGWFDAANGGSLYTWPHTLTGNITMYAHWRDNTLPPPTPYTITFETHGGPAVAALTADEGTAVAEPAVVREGYTFTGWFDAAAGGTEYNTWPYTLNGNVTMHARWTIITYTITYILDGGTNAGINPGSYTVDSPEITLAPPAYTGYTFGGWYDNAGFDGNAADTIPAGSTGDKTFYAKWLHNVPVRIELWINEEGDILASGDDVTVSKTGSGYPANFTATVTSAYSGIQWYLNGGPVSGDRGAAQSITVNAADYGRGSCYLGVTVTRDGVPYSTDIHFTVID